MNKHVKQLELKDNKEAVKKKYCEKTKELTDQ